MKKEKQQASPAPLMHSHQQVPVWSFTSLTIFVRDVNFVVLDQNEGCGHFLLLLVVLVLSEAVS